MRSHTLADLGPDVEQRALALVVTCSVLMGRSEVSDDDGAVDCGDDFAKRHLDRRSGQYVTASYTAL